MEEFKVADLQKFTVTDWQQRAEDIIDFSPDGDSRAVVTLKTKRSFTHIFELAGLLHSAETTLQESITTLQNTVATLQTENTALQREIESLKDRITALEDKVLDTEIENLKNNQGLVYDATLGKWTNKNVVVEHRDD